MKRGADSAAVDGEEEAFPRGRPVNDSVGDAGESHPQGAQPKGDKTRRKRARKAGAADAEDEEATQAPGALDALSISHAPRLRIHDLVEGTLLVAAVRESNEDELTLNLPFNIVGHVSRAQASEARFAEAEELPPLTERFQPGQLVVAVVLAVVDKSNSRQSRIDLSLRPSLANAGLAADGVLERMSLTAVVDSEEEHVLRLDFGIEGLAGLLKKSEVSNMKPKLRPGCIVQVTAQAVNVASRTVRCTVAVEQAIKGNEPMPANALKAGFLMNARLNKVLPAESDDGTNAGLVLGFCNVLAGVVHWHHQGQGLSKPPEYTRKQLMTARVIAVVPGASGVVVHMSLLPHILDWSNASTAIGGVSVGDRLDGQVVDVTSKFGVRLKCALPSDSGAAGRVAAFCPNNRMTDKDKDAGVEAGETAAQKLDVGSKGPCRVLGFNFLEGTLVVTKRPYDLKDDTLVAVTELHPGQFVSGTITRVTDFGVFVQLSEYVVGLVQLRQLTDVPLASVSKKHQVGSKLKCRVLKIFPERRQVSLTAKKSLVRDTFQFASFDQARKDMLVTGYVSAMKDYGAIVCFYGDQYGLIPAQEMEQDEAPAVGMAVKCRIASVGHRRKRIGLSLDTTDAKEPSEFVGAESEGPESSQAEPGDVVSDIQVVDCVEEGVLVQFKSKRTGDASVKGFVPKAHLSDSTDLAVAQHTALLAAHGAGASTPALGVFASGGVVLAKRFNPRVGRDGKDPEKEQDHLPWAALVSVKPTLRLAAEEGDFVTSLDQLQESRLYTGYVKEVFDFGAVVSLGGWKVAGVAPKHQLSERFVDKPTEELAPGQTVRALIGRIEAEKQRFIVDLRPAAASSTDAPLLRREAEALRLYFEQQAALAPPEALADPWPSLSPGTVLDGKVTDVKPYGVLLSLPAHPGLTALALKRNSPEGTEWKDGQELKCAVLDFDVNSKIVDVSCQPELIAAGSSAAAIDGLLAAPASKSSSKRKRKERASGISGADDAAPREVSVLPALLKQAYDVVWTRDPPAVMFAPAFERRRRWWANPLPTLVHSLVGGDGSVKRLVARFPLGGSADQRAQRERVRVPKILRPAEELSVGAPVTMRVQSVKGLQLVCSAPVGLRGHVHVTQLEDLDREAPGGSKPLDGLKAKTIIEARVLQMQQHGDGKSGKIWHLELTCKPSLMLAKDVSEYEAEVLRWSKLKRGRWVQAAICEVKKSFLWVELSPTIRGQINLLDATDELGKLRAPTEHFHVGQLFPAQVLRCVTSQKKLDLALVGDVMRPAKPGKTLARLIKIEDMKGRGVAASFRLPGQRRGFVHVTELFDFWAQFPLRRLKPGNCYEVYLIRSDADTSDGGKEGAEGDVVHEGDATNARAELSLRPSLVHGQAEGADERRPLTAAEVQVGQKVSGYVVNANGKGVFVALSRSLVGRIRLRALSDQVVLRDQVEKLHPIGELIRDVTVIEVDAENGRVELSLRQGGAAGRLTIEHLSVGDVLSGRVKVVEQFGMFVRLDNSNIDALIHKTEVSDTASVSLDSYKAGAPIPKMKVLKVEGSKVWCGIKPSHFDGDDEDMDDLEDEDEDDDDAVADGEGGEAKADEKVASADEEAKEDAKNADEAMAKKKKKKAAAAAAAAEAANSDDEVPWAAAAGTGLGGNASDAAFRFAEFQVAGDSGSEDGAQEDEEDEEDGGDAKRPSKRQKKALKAAEAKELRQREAENADGQWSNDPRSIEDFERMLLTQGDTSIIWIRYMAFHLKMSDLERARQVAERAVKHVGFSDAKERFNAWVAYMNLECTFGTDQTAEALFTRASSHNDAKQVHMQLARIHERNKKPELATKVYDLCTKKFPQSKKVWLAFLTFLYGQGDLEGGRKTLPKCLAIIPRRKHPVVVSKTALLEYRHGSVERGRSIFEGLLDSYPKRTDLWSVYIDAHIKAHTPPKAAKANLVEVRGILERCCAMKLKAAKMRFFFKRWLDFEKRWGDAESQELVRSKAREFVESQAS